MALCSKRIRFFLAKRWTGKNEACSQITLLDCFHGILKPAYLLYCKRFASDAKAERSAAPEIDPDMPGLTDEPDEEEVQQLASRLLSHMKHVSAHRD